ncbi:MAG: FkbM family methyltransferase [Pseudonocardiaceae bacterium]
MCTGHRILLDLRSGSEWFAFYTGESDDSRIAAAHLLLTEPGSIVIDAGANIGFWSVPLARRAADIGGRLVAIEPVPANATRLRGNLGLNDLNAVADVVEVAVSDRNGREGIVLREDFAAGAVTGNAALEIDDGTDARFVNLLVMLIRLDDLLEQRYGHVRVHIIKADLEGHEDRFLAGALRTFSRCRPIAFVEWNRIYYERRKVDPTVVVGILLRKLSYRCLRERRGLWTNGATFWSPREVDDLVLVPAEKAADVRAMLNATVPAK